jgi:hypothetical protein
MDTLKPTKNNRDADREKPPETAQPEKTAWQTPTLEDVSEQVMAQPYIRFT